MVLVYMWGMHQMYLAKVSGMGADVFLNPLTSAQGAMQQQQHAGM